MILFEFYSYFLKKSKILCQTVVWTSLPTSPHSTPIGKSVIQGKKKKTYIFVNKYAWNGIFKGHRPRSSISTFNHYFFPSHLTPCLYFYFLLFLSQFFNASSSSSSSSSFLLREHSSQSRRYHLKFYLLIIFHFIFS